MALTSASSEKTMAVETIEARDRKVSFEGRPYHVYYHRRIWNPELGEVAKVAEVTVAVLEDDNTHDRYAVTKVRDLIIISSLASFSIERSLTF